MVAQNVADHLLSICARPHDLDGHRVVSTASIGLVTCGPDYHCAPDMIRDADAAMYQAKASGRGRVVVFDEQMHYDALERLCLEQDLRTALDNDQFKLVYQPIVDLIDARPRGAEALLRWNHPVRGVVSPAQFIPIAEEAGLIGEIGQWVLRSACQQLAEWKSARAVPEGFAVSVNVSKQQLLEPWFRTLALEAVRDHGLRISDVKLEVTETTVVDNRSEICAILQQLRDEGLTIVMDDFGTGHSSLSGLHTLPIDELKIDRSFIEQTDRNRKLIAITSSIVALADHLTLRTVGEGIETPEHVATLQALGCDYGQGYYFSRPLPPEQLIEFVRSDEQRRAA